MSETAREAVNRLLWEYFQVLLDEVYNRVDKEIGNQMTRNNASVIKEYEDDVRMCILKHVSAVAKEIEEEIFHRAYS